MREPHKDDKEPLGPTLPDHEIDGIREEDNPMPRWWTGMFLVFVLFGIVYVPVVHIFGFVPHRQLDRATAQAARLQEQREIEAEASGALDKDPVAAGQKYFKTFCVSCHGANAEGGIGPNLHDAFWIHGPQEDSIRSVISNGVAAKGMPTWGPILGERKVKALTAYTMTLWNVPLAVPGKKPEGREYDMAAVRGSVASEPASEKAN